MLEDLQIRNYAPTAVAAYIRGVAEFAKHFNKSPEFLGPEQIREYQLHLIKEKGVSLSSYIQAVCGLRFLYTNTLHLPIDIARIPLPRYEKKLPLILSPGEVKLLLEAPKNLGYRAMLTTMYAAGPRVSEVSRLKIPDIDSGRGVIWIRGGKGHKDLRKAFRKGKLQFNGELKLLAEPTAFEALCQQASQIEWVVYAKRPFGGPEQVLKYLARYRTA
jgi:site-specific recombinase XerD